MNDSTYRVHQGEPGRIEDSPVRVPAQWVIEMGGEPVGGDRMLRETTVAFAGLFIDN